MAGDAPFDVSFIIFAKKNVELEKVVLLQYSSLKLNSEGIQVVDGIAYMQTVVITDYKYEEEYK